MEQEAGLGPGPHSASGRPGPGMAPAGSPADQSVLADFRAALLASAPPGELDGLDETAFASLAAAAFRTFQRRAPGTAAVHVGAGEGDAGQRRMLVVLVTDDMPFLVDSATGAVTAAGLEIHRLLHPVLAVSRDPAGMVTGIGGAALRESVIVMEVERAPARLRGELQATLESAYADVRAAVSDWQPMLAALRASARALNEYPPPVAPHVLSETIAFLDWIAADNFTFLAADAPEGKLGILRRRPLALPDVSALGPDRPVIVSKSVETATVHRLAPLDVLTVRRYDPEGRATGAARFAGLFTSSALSESPRRVPLVRRKVAEVTERLGYDPRGHAGKALAHVIETFPREELFQIDSDRLQVMAEGLLSLLDRPRPRLFARVDEATGQASVIVYVPRDLYAAELRQEVAAMLAEVLGGRVARYEVELRAEGLARVHYVLEAVRHPADEARLNAELARLTRGWHEALEAALAEVAGPVRAARLVLTHGKAFSLAYRSAFSPAEAARDILHLTELSTPEDRRVALFRRAGDPETSVRLKIYRLGEIIALSDAVPTLENFGFRVIEEAPFGLAGGRIGWIHDFRLELPAPPGDFAAFVARVEPALVAVLSGAQENDLFNALIPTVGLSAREANWLRAIFRYLRQTGASYGVQTAVDALKRNAAATRALIRLFRARLDPEADEAEAEAAAAGFEAALDAIGGIDDDRILRLFGGVVRAVLRTNAFAPAGLEALAFKLDSALVPGLPKPVPWREIWVHARRVEGIHLRGGPIARGGLRWSDRRDDFRTEVLGLVKAQMVKNAVIVPTGAKGGFYPKLLPDPSDRDAWLAEGAEAYRTFIRALLSVTDNIGPDGAVVPPEGVRRRDGDDPYLVVAADKGTATFSDLANAIAEERGFWLGDAFASGGSAGYDHKAMGITARGAWVCVERHFAELGIDVASDPVTVAGVGDMSGDVFGNGMLLSKAIRLVAAFDHRHIFLDPAPDPARAHAERLRLFRLPRSSWADYDPAALSPGGGVFPRTQKTIPLSPEVRALLAVEAEEMAPSELIAAILRAPVDLLWFGGIGTFVKAARESHAEVGDRANDAHRVNAEDVRARVIGEGANLAVTQRGRIAFAAAGGRINTDFIDNSAGVNTSDVEVNMKIALGAAERAGRLGRDERNALLRAMTGEVAALVLANNRAQTLALSVAEARGPAELSGQIRLMEVLEAGGLLDRLVETLPDAREVASRRLAGQGLTRPELSVLLAYAKIDLKAALVDSVVLADPLLEEELFGAFPEGMRARFAEEIRAHRLRREIIATRIANALVNEGGLTLAHGLAAELAAPLDRVAAAFLAARHLFDLPGLWAEIAGSGLPERQRLDLQVEAVAAARPLIADLMRRTGVDAPSRLIGRIGDGLRRIEARLDRLLRPEPRAQLERIRRRLLEAGVPHRLVGRIVTLHAMAGAVGVAALASDLGLEEAATAEAYTRLGEALLIDWARGAAAQLQPTDSWERLLASTVVRSFETVRLELIRRITPAGGDPLAAVETWLAAHEREAQALLAAMRQGRSSGPPTLAMLAHLAGLARHALAA